MAEVGGILNSQGWYLSSEGLAQCLELCKEKGWEPTARNVEKVALNPLTQTHSTQERAWVRGYKPHSLFYKFSLCVGAQSLSDDIVRNLEHQIQKVKNIAVPSTKQHHPSPSRRLLRLHLTDGHVYCSAVETEGAVDNLSTSTPPGTKVRLFGTMVVQNSFILLKKTSVEVLGGTVEHLIKKWNMQKIVPNNVERSREGVAGPPPFVSFKDSRRDVQSKMPPKSDLPSSSRKPGSRPEVERSTESSRVETGGVRSAFTDQTRSDNVKTARGRGRGAGFGEESRRLMAPTELDSRVQHGRGRRSGFQREDRQDDSSVGRGRGGRRHQYSAAEGMPEVGKQARSERHPNRGFSRDLNEGERNSAAPRHYPQQRPQHSQSSRDNTRGQSSSHQLSEWLDQKLNLDSEVFSVTDSTAEEAMGYGEGKEYQRRPYFKDSSRYEDEKQRERRPQKEDERSHKSHYRSEAHREKYHKERQHDKPGASKYYARLKPWQQSEHGEGGQMDTQMQGDGQRREQAQRRELRKLREGKRETRPRVIEAWVDREDDQSRSRSTGAGDSTSRSTVSGDSRTRSTVGGDSRTQSTGADDSRTQSTVGGDSRTRSTVGGDSRSRSTVGRTTVTVGSGGSDQYNWDWVNKSAPYSASKQNH